MMRLSGTNRRKRIISFFLLITFVSEILTPTATFALTAGPSQPEVQAFTPVSTAEMVDLGSGDFKYNIPLMDVGGYPLNIAYNSGIGMDDEASWTGLGWNLNVGSINRNMRGLPDDFNGEVIEKELNMKDNTTYGVNVGVGIELFGNSRDGQHGNSPGKLNMGLAINYNNYTGIGIEQSASMGISAGNPSKGRMNAGLGMKSSKSGGLTISPSLSFSHRYNELERKDGTSAESAAIGIGMSVNSRAGLKDFNINANYTRQRERTYKRETSTGMESVDIDASGGTGAAGIVNFGASTYVPSIQQSMVNNSVALSFKLGTTVFGLDGDVTIGGYYSNQSLMNPYTSTAAYGYMFSHVGQESDNVLMDFNREKDQAFSRYTKNLPVTNQTYDVFSVTGQGIGGAFRPFRSDVGYVFDNRATNTSDSYSLGGEFGGGQTAHLGIDMSVVDVNTVSGKWKDDNDARNHLKALAETGNKAYEPYYFREVGEKSADDVQNALYRALGGDEAYRIKLDRTVEHLATDVLENSESGIPISLQSHSYQLPKRQKRNQVMSALNLEEAALYGLDKAIYNSQPHSAGMDISSAAKPHHIAEITALRVDGSRYIYGLPAYNTLQEEISFNASATVNASNQSVVTPHPGYDKQTGYVTYGANDISVSNAKGIDNYYSRVKMPAYAHSYLLTAIVSPDYVDLTGDGITDDDYGNYTKFEYERAINPLADKPGSFKWRMPYNANRANFNENGKSIQNDDHANFVYGEKELWFVKKIITKNYVAVFKLGNRHDALGVQDVNGGLATNAVKNKYLESISLYARPEYVINPATAVPIKVVHFTYDYSLCPNVPNNDQAQELVNGSDINANHGKLTLKEIYFTYGKSDKARYSKYEFAYGQSHGTIPAIGANNFVYHPKAYDRWGNYMPVDNQTGNYVTATTMTSVSTPTSVYTYDADLNNAEFPYVDQYNKADADYRTSAWNLTRIGLPSGAEINITYESDDYAFVQNRPAMQMLKVIGISDNNTIGAAAASGTVGDLFTSATSLSENHRKFLFFELTENLNYGGSSAMASALITQKYLKDMNSDGKYMYFRFLVNLTSRTGPAGRNVGDHFEYVSGYAELDGRLPECGIVSGVTTAAGRQIGYVRLKDVDRDDKVSIGSLRKTNPITKAALNLGKTHYNNIVWDASFSPPASIGAAVKQLASEAKSGPVKALFDAIKGPNNTLMGKDYGKEFVYGKSWIRLYNPNGRKFGGGSRVKSLSIKDKWEVMTGGQDASEYGQEFSYETVFQGETVSSGVVSYEPMLGGDENPFRQPVFMGPNKFTMLIPDERFFMEEPFGEMFFPSASVAYSKVKVRNKIPATANVKTHGTGYVVHEFYTAKDYPTITSHTPINSRQYKPPLGGLLKVMSRDYMAATQGYVIKLNDMHGKPKAQAVYAEGSSTPISKVEYFYKTKGGDYTEYGLKDMHSDASCPPNELDNTCVTINENGQIGTQAIGTDFDAVADFRETQTTTVMGGAQINLSTFLLGTLPAAVPTIWPSYSFEKTRLRSAVLTKVINHYALLERTVAHDNGSSVSTANLAYDAQTGDVLVTRTKNDFEDDIYSVKYPAFWYYKLMGAASENIGYSELVSFSSPGVASVSVPGQFNVGDEVTLGGGNVGWVCSVGANSITVMDRSGNLTANGSNVLIKVLRSGRRNLLGSPMASLTCLKNPVDSDNDPSNGLNAVLDVKTNGSADDGVLNASAVQYSDQWQTFKGFELSTNTCSSSLSPQGTAMKNFIQTLVAHDKFQNPLIKNGSANFNSAMIRSASGTYTLGFSSALYNASYMPQGANGLQWYFKPNANTPNIAEFGVGCDPACFNSPFENCGHIIATAPGWFDWGSSRIVSITSFSVNPTSCSPDIEVCATYLSKANMVTPLPVCFSIRSAGLCWNLVSTSTSVAISHCGVDVGDKVNPFVYGLKGSWRPKVTWSYLEDRKQQAVSGTVNNLDIRKDGAFKAFNPYYTPVAGSWSVTPSNWTYTSEITKHTPHGTEVENKDALGRYSAALYGYNQTLPLAVASNARLQEIAFDGFEDYGYSYAGRCGPYSIETHFDFGQYAALLDKTTAHSGKRSMRVDPNTTLKVSKRLMSSACTTPVSPVCSYTLTCSDFVYPFMPVTYEGSKKYILSYWVKEVSSTVGAPSVNYLNSSIYVFAAGGSGSVTMGTMKRSDIIDGWQRFEQEFVISANASGRLNVALVNASVSSVSYFDDIRIHPFNSNMKSFVYDPITLRYLAELDANNFATFYEYDEEGSLIRVKKETEKGIMTIQETKNHTKR